ncbi:MAG: FecCD family ABC transporter permease [Catenisphaera adipataccumulans]|jgi:iron complex transport system permease protein|uniref:FecCD family ABC transporter permease n=1 Tax=Catenisphaera adipataccumulans TaxID=700500 RepID=UPI003D8D29D4
MRTSVTTKTKIILSILFCLLLTGIAVAAGSISISGTEMAAILRHHLFHASLPSSISAMTDTIFWKIRLPRVLVAFLVGGMLSVSGAVLQAVLENPLASSYTLGVSSGACLGAALVMVLPISAAWALPAGAFVFGLATVLVVLGLTRLLDRSAHNETIILVGIVFSLFVNAVMTLINVLYADNIRQLYMWMMGSFSSRGWQHIKIMLPVCIVGCIILSRCTKELDLLTFGDEQAMAMGVQTSKVKRILILTVTMLTAISVCFTGTIGFIDLVAPHVVRRIFGPQHRVVLPMAFVYGGGLLAFADMLSRCLAAPLEIPVGAIMALVGAPFFALLYFRKRSL